MTVITKPISEKKADKLEQPLVAAECLPNRDVEGGVANSLPPQDPRYLVLRTRARRASSVTTACLLMMALLVMCCGVLGGFYLYKQFAHSQSKMARIQKEFRFNRELETQEESNLMMHRLRGWCRIPYEDEGDQMALFAQNKPFAEFQEYRNRKMEMDVDRELHFMKEEFDIDADSDSVERLTVPDFDGGRSSRFIHDFNSNNTGIIDMDAHRCFVMALNRSQVLPPQSLIDLVRKMWAGYYDVDTERVRETMRVVLPPISDRKSAGLYIERECDGYPIYQLEKIVTGVFKRSTTDESGVFTYFSGKYVQLKIVNEEELKAYEQEHPSS